MTSQRVASVHMIDAGATIAIIDDDPGIRTGLTKLLHSGSYKALAYESAEEFFAHAGTREIACLIVDINLPGINGVEMVKRLRQSGAATPAILMTGRDDASTEQLLDEAVDVPKLRKPFTAADLLETVMVVMHG